MSQWLSVYNTRNSQELLSEEDIKKDKELLYSQKLEDYYNEGHYDQPISSLIIDDAVNDLLEPKHYLDIEEFLEDNIIPEPENMSRYSIALTLATTVPLFVLLTMMNVPLIINCIFTGTIFIFLGWYSNRVFYESDFIEASSQYHNYSLIDYHLDIQYDDDKSTINDKKFIDSISDEYDNIKNNAIQYYQIIQSNPSDKVIMEAKRKLQEELEIFINHYNDQLEAKKQADSEIRELDKFHKDIQDDASIVSISMINDNHKARYSY